MYMYMLKALCHDIHIHVRLDCFVSTSLVANPIEMGTSDMACSVKVWCMNMYMYRLETCNSDQPILFSRNSGGKKIVFYSSTCKYMRLNII